MSNQATEKLQEFPGSEVAPENSFTNADKNDSDDKKFEIAELKRQLSEQTRYFDAILSSAKDFAYTFDREGRFVFVNQALLNLWGLKFEQAIGKNFFDLEYPADLARRLHNQIQQVFDTKQIVTDETPYISPTGIAGYYEYIFSPFCGADGAVELVVGTTRDITERQEMEEILRHSEEQYRTLFNSIDEGFCTIELLFDDEGQPYDYRFIEYNPVFKELTGLQNADGKTALELVPNLEKKWVEIYGKVALTGESIRFEDNSEPLNRWFDVYASRVGDETSRKVALVFTNVTERRQMEEALRDADRRKDEFLATLAHELRNPLAPIRSGLEVIRNIRNDKAKFEETLEILERQTNQIVHLVDDLLDISRITQGKIKLRLERFELKTAIEMALETSQGLIDESENELTISLPEKPIFINADLTRTTQIFLNILNNAAKYSDQGGKISLKANTENGNAVISIKDTGLGIEPDMLEKIFDMFGQIETPYEQARGGLGIGLSVVEKLVEMHGGSIEAFSEGNGKGSEFVVRLPLAAEQSAEIAAIPHSEDDILQKAQMKMPENQTQEKSPLLSQLRRILVVDDNSDAVEMMEILLSMEGYATRTAFDGETALEIAREFLPEVCLCDIGLPEMNGYELAGHLRKLLPEALLVSVSGWGQEEDRQRSIKSGFNYHLVKPVQFEDLLKLIKKQPDKAA